MATPARALAGGSGARGRHHAGVALELRDRKRDLPLSTFLAVASTLNVGVGDLLDIPEMVIVRDSAIGRAVARLVERPELAERLAPAALGEAAS